MWIIIGLVLGGLIGLQSGFDEAALGMLLGALVGVGVQFFSRNSKADNSLLKRLEARVETLEHRLDELGGEEVVVLHEPQTVPQEPTMLPLEEEDAITQSNEQSEPSIELLPDEAINDGWVDIPADRKVSTPSSFDQLYSNVHAWLLGGNTVVRIGLVVLFFGMAFLVRYAVEHSMFPIELRLAGVAAGGIALLVVGWRLRHKRVEYALSLQGGGVAVLYLTIFAAMRLYQVIPPTLGFVLLLAAVMFSALLAVLQNSQTLAVIGTAGGFMAPILASTGQGNHVLLFGYYLLLNLGVLAIAWKKAWKILNLVGFVFTFSIALAWGARDYRPDMIATTEPFLIAFVLMYVAVAVLFAWLSAPSLKHYVDGTLVFGTPVVGFGLQAALVQDIPYGLAWSALGLGGFYVLLARWLYGRLRPSLNLLVESFLVLGVAFLTLAIPLALDGKWTSAAWAMEGAALLWVGVRQSRKLAIASGLALQLAAGLFFAGDSGLYKQARVWPLFNMHMLGALLVALAGFVSSLMADRYRDRWSDLLTVMAPALLIWATLWWLTGGMLELDAWLNSRQMVAAVLAFFAASGVLATLMSKRLNWHALAWLGLLALPGMALSLLMAAAVNINPASGWSGVAWLLAIAAAGFGLYQSEGASSAVAKVLGYAHTALLWLVAMAVVLSVTDFLDDAVVGVAWEQASVLVVLALVLTSVMRLTDENIWPFGSWRSSYVWIGGSGVVIVMLLWALSITLSTGGDVAPLPYLPLLNPLDLAMLIALFVAFRWWQANSKDASAWWPDALKVFAVIVFVLANGALLRTLHHLLGLPWNGAMFSSDVVQASLSLFWGVLGLALAFIASRRQRRTLWMVGAGLLGVVVAKLFLVDMANTGTVARIVSFLGAGVLLLVVGYFSPLPPAKEESA